MTANRLRSESIPVHGAKGVFCRPARLCVAAVLVCVLCAGTRVAAETTAPVVASPADLQFFRVTVVDEETSRGIPAVKLTLTNSAEYWTDNAGVVAFWEPDLMGQPVYFRAETHGYEIEPEPWFGMKGPVLTATPGGSGTVVMKRRNIAQRLYRWTGQGLYRESLMLGDRVPDLIEHGKLPIMGQDGGDAVLYNGRLYWLWGDSNIPQLNLAIYRSTCAVSDLPGRGGLDPDVGIKLTYLRDQMGNARGMINLPGTVYWYAHPRVVHTSSGAERFLTNYMEVSGGDMRTVERGLVEFNNDSAVFDFVTSYPVDTAVPFGRMVGAVPFRHTEGGREYLYYPAYYPAVRCPSDYESQNNLQNYEMFTCLKPGARFDGTASQLDRDEDGNLRWGWRAGTSIVDENDMTKLIEAGAMDESERWYAARDIETGERVHSHQGSVYWNEYRKRWVCIRLEMWGRTLIGETWYLEGDTPLGPWVFARKIVTHKWEDHDAAFYIAGQIPYFDKEDGRVIYFKGSLSAQFGSAKNPAQRHNYNMFMYKLELDDPRLILPVPVYEVKAKDGATTGARYGTKEAFVETERDRDIVWYAPDRQGPGTIPVYQSHEDGGRVRLAAERPRGPDAKPVFHALPALTDDTTSAVKQTAPLYEFVGADGSGHIYSTAETVDGYTKTAGAVCRVWPSPIRFNPYRLEEAGSSLPTPKAALKRENPETTATR
jgi:hypothetical protein